MFSLFKKHQAEETALIEKRIKDAFPKEQGLDGDVQNRILNRVAAASGIPKPNTSIVVQNRRIKPGRFLVATGLITVFAMLALFSGKIYLPLKAFNTEKALAAIEKPGMITYFKVTANYKGDDLYRVPDSEAEYWVDYEKQVFKCIRSPYPKTGDTDSTSYLLIRDGKAIEVEMRDGEIDNVFERDALGFLDDNPIADSFRRYRELLKNGEAKVLGEEEIKGIATYKIMAKSTTKDGTTEAEIANIRKDTHEPVKITYEVWKTQQGKESKLSAETTIFIDEIKLIDPKDLGKDVFAIDIPKDVNYLISRNLSIKQARQFKEFDLYYLGESFDGFKFTGDIHFSKRIGGPDMPGDPRHSAYVSYLNLDLERPGGVGIFIWPTIEPDIENAVLIQDVERTNVTINGNPAVLTVQEGHDYNVYRLFINAGSSTLYIASHGKDEAEEKDRVIRAAESLIKIN